MIEDEVKYLSRCTSSASVVFARVPTARVPGPFGTRVPGTMLPRGFPGPRTPPARRYTHLKILKSQTWRQVDEPCPPSGCALKTCFRGKSMNVRGKSMIPVLQAGEPFDKKLETRPGKVEIPVFQAGELLRPNSDAPPPHNINTHQPSY